MNHLSDLRWLQIFRKDGANAAEISARAVKCMKSFLKFEGFQGTPFSGSDKFCRWLRIREFENFSEVLNHHRQPSSRIQAERTLVDQINF